MGINTTSHIMQYCVTWHFSQQCMAERATWLSFYYHFIVFWRHPAKQLFGMFSYCKKFGVYIIGESNYSFFLIYGQGHKSAVQCSKSRDLPLIQMCNIGYFCYIFLLCHITRTCFKTMPMGYTGQYYLQTFIEPGVSPNGRDTHLQIILLPVILLPIM